MSGFTTKRVECQGHVFMSLDEASAGRKPVRGFTLIEAMIAVTILAIAVSGPLVTASRAIVAAEIARDQLTAAYLAQEVIEYVRAMRDDEYLASYRAGGTNIAATAWNNFLHGSDDASLTNCIYSNTAGAVPGQIVCTLDPTLPMHNTQSGSSLQRCTILAGQPLPACTNLYLADNGTTKFYTQQSNLGGTQTQFRRIIQVDTVSANSEHVISQVDWNFHGSTYSIQVSDNLSPWQ